VEKGRGDVHQAQDRTFWRDACTQALFGSPYPALRELAPSQTASWIREIGMHIMCAGLLLTVIVN